MAQGFLQQTLYVGGLDGAVSIDELLALFSSFGAVSNVYFPASGANPDQRAFAFVEFEEPEDAKAAVDNIHLSELNGRVIKCNWARIGPDANYEPTQAIWRQSQFVAQSQQQPSTESQRRMAFLDICVKEETLRFVFSLRYDVAPRACENFRLLCTGKLGYGYAGSSFHRIIPEFMAQGGDFTEGDGTGGKSAFATADNPRGVFPDESFALKHDAPGTLSMANSGPNTNTSQFFITLSKASWLDGKHVVFGTLQEGQESLRKLAAAGSESGKCTSPVTIVRAGEC